MVCFTRLMAPLELKHARPETALPTVTFPLVSAVTDPVASSSVEPWLHPPWPGELTVTENVVVPLCLPFQVIVPPLAETQPARYPYPGQRCIPSRSGSLSPCRWPWCTTPGPTPAGPASPTVATDTGIANAATTNIKRLMSKSPQLPRTIAAEQTHHLDRQGCRIVTTTLDHV